jgi:hypothetical protein
VIERHVQQLYFLSRPEIPPTAREFRGVWHVMEGDDATVFGANAELAVSLDRRTCHRFRYLTGS